MRNAYYLSAVVLTTVMLSACAAKPPDSSANQNARPPVASTAATRDETDKWVGKWIGPEGSFLEIAGHTPQYQLVIANLDGPRSFQGLASGDTISFERDGNKESIRAGNGVETGMKWLADKSNCLVVKPGEGYCRDQW